MPLDADGDERLTWNEVWAKRDRLAGFLGGAVRVTRGGESCDARVGAPWLTDRLGLPYLSVDMDLVCAKEGLVGVGSDTFFDADASHRMLVSIRSGNAVQVATLSPSARAWSQAAAPSPL